MARKTIPQYTDTERLDWLLERILLSRRVSFILDSFGMTERDLTGPGDQNLGDIFRKAVDRRVHQDATKAA
jgi:hypothetical protein